MSEAYQKRKKYFNTDQHRTRMRKQMKIRRKAEKQGRVSKGDGKHIDHSDGNWKNWKKSNLKITTAKFNRTKPRKKYKKWSK